MIRLKTYMHRYGQERPSTKGGICEAHIHMWPCLNNKQIPESIDGFHKFQDEEYYKFLSRYKFHLSFENAVCKDYMTEKLFRPLEIGVNMKIDANMLV